MTLAESASESTGGRDFAKASSAGAADVEGPENPARLARRGLAEESRGASADSRTIVRIRFGKDGPLRFISHNNLLRLWDRLLRRTGLPVRLSQGFHPHLIVSSPLALPLGAAGAEEIIQLELEQPIDEAEIRRRIEREADPGLELVSVTALATRGSLRPRAMEYRCTLPIDVDRAAVRESISRVMALEAFPITRRTPGKPSRTLDLRDSLEALDLVDGEVWFRVRVSPAGSARPDEVLAAIGLEGILARGARLVRSKLELEGDA